MDKRLKELEKEITPICEEHYTDCTSCPARELCAEYDRIAPAPEKTKIESLNVIGKRWNDGFNTYHTATIIVNGEEFKSKITYGYDDHYLQTAAEILARGFYDIPRNALEAFNFVSKFPHTAIDVKRKRDL